MPGDARYGGFSNEQLANYLGISVPEVQMLQELMQGNPTAADVALAQKFASQTYPTTPPANAFDATRQSADAFGGPALGGQPQSSSGPMGGANRLENIMLGLQNLQAHPLGSQHHGFNPTDFLANFSTGGLYGLGKGIANKDYLSAINSPGQWGSTVQPIGNQIEPGMGTSLAMRGNIAGIGAGIGGIIGGSAAGSGATVPSEASGSSIPYITDSAGNVAQNVVEGTGGALPGTTMTPAGLEQMIGGVAGSAAGSMTGPLIGASLAQQLSGLIPQSGGEGQAPAVSRQPGMPGSIQISRPAVAPSGTEMDTPGVGYIDPAYIKRQKGKGNSRGISDQGDLSQQQQDAKMAALWGFSGGTQ